MATSYGVLGDNPGMLWMKLLAARAGLVGWKRRLALPALTLWTCLSPALAQIPGLGQPAATGATLVTPQVEARLTVHAPQGVQAGQTFWLGLALRHQPEWHTYWRNPGDSGLPTQLTWELPQQLHAGEVQWPLPRKLKAGPLTNYGYDGDALLVVPVQVDANWVPRPTLDIRLHANWLVCRLECIPQEGDFQLRLPTQTSTAGDAAAFAAVQAQQPVAAPVNVTSRFDGPYLRLTVRGLPAAMRGQRLAVFPEQAELLDSAAEQHPLALQSWQDDTLQLRLPQSSTRSVAPARIGLLLVAENGEHPVAARVDADLPTPWPAPPAPGTVLTAPETDGWGFVLALLGALAGGLILNLMPCVLPVLALKVLAFARHGEARRAHRLAGLAYTAGVLASFLALGGTVLALRSAGEQLGWGFQLQSPWTVGLLALLFLLVALNLFGLFEIGRIVPSALLSLQARHPVLDALLSGVLAVAVASPCTAPFMGASLGVAVTLPPWQALAIFAALGLGLALPYLLASWWPAVAALLPRPGRWMLTLRRVLGLPMLATVFWLLWVLAQQTGWIATAQKTGDGWGVWSETAVAQSLAQHKPVFVDFTAAWCVTCQINERTALADAEVQADFARLNVTRLRADWTRRDPEITAALTALGRSGVPVYVLYAPERPPQVLSELLTAAQVREALAQLPPLPATAR